MSSLRLRHVHCDTKHRAAVWDVSAQAIQYSSVNNCTNRITPAPYTLPFQLPVVPDKPQIRASETKPNPNVTLTLILTLILTLTLLTLLSPRCNTIGRYV